MKATLNGRGPRQALSARGTVTDRISIFRTAACVGVMGSVVSEHPLTFRMWTSEVTSLLPGGFDSMNLLMMVRRLKVTTVKARDSSRRSSLSRVI